MKKKVNRRGKKSFKCWKRKPSAKINRGKEGNGGEEGRERRRRRRGKKENEEEEATREKGRGEEVEIKE